MMTKRKRIKALENEVEKLKERMRVLEVVLTEQREELKELLRTPPFEKGSQERPVTTAQVLDEWLNGKEQSTEQ